MCRLSKAGDAFGSVEQKEEEHEKGLRQWLSLLEALDRLGFRV